MKIPADSPIYHAARAVMIGFPKTASSHGKGYSKAADVRNFPRFFTIVYRGFQSPFMWLLVALKNPKPSQQC